MALGKNIIRPPLALDSPGRTSPRPRRHTGNEWVSHNFLGDGFRLCFPPRGFIDAQFARWGSRLRAAAARRLGLRQQ
jgi:hypothetical protein